MSRRALAGVMTMTMALAMSPEPALAFVKACHQGITTEAFDGAAWPTGATPPELEARYKLLIDDLSIDVAPRVRNFWVMSALIGNQYSDQGPYDLKDLVSLAQFGAAPNGQRDHCLRSAHDDGPDGNAKALAACKAYIVEQIGIALGTAEVPDLAARETVRLHLVFSGQTDVPLNRYAFHLGQATHALQDSFTHTFRSPDLKRVRTVLNWVDWLEGGNDYVVDRDGFQHLSALDACGESDKGGIARRDAAKQATTELIAAVASDVGGRAGRLARAEAVVASWFQIEEGCNEANDWCDAPERKMTSLTGCSIGPAAGNSNGPGLLPAMLGLVMLLTCRRKRNLIAALLFMLGAPAAARAAQTDTETAKEAAAVKKDDHPVAKAEQKEHADRGEIKGGVIGKATPAEQRQLEAHPFGIIVKAGIAIDNAAYDVGGGVRLDISKGFTIGLDAEYNPWISIETRRTKPGTTNIYGVGIYRLNVRDYLELRVTAGAGVSILMFDTFAARKGSIGPYFAISPLGVAFRMSGTWRLIIDPAEIIIPIPQPKGIPLVYRQHRATVALQANF